MKKKINKIAALLSAAVIVVCLCVLPAFAYDNLPSTVVVVHGDFADWLELANGDDVYNWSINFSDGNWFGYNVSINPDACIYYDGSEYYPYDGSSSFVYVCSSYTTTDIDNVSSPLYVSVYTGGVGVSGYQTSIQTSYANGYDAGYSASSQEQYTWYDLMFAVVEAPVNAFQSLFSFEIFGVNIAGFLISLLMVLLVIAIVKKFI